MGKPRFTHHSMPGDRRSFALATLLAFILSPGATSASALRPAMPPVASTTSASPTILCIGQSPQLPRHAKSLMVFHTAANESVLHRAAVKKQRGSRADSPICGVGRHRSARQGVVDHVLVVPDLPADEHDPPIRPT